MGYHGWHDWYSAQCVSPDNFGTIFLAGLNTKGILEEYSKYTKAASPESTQNIKNIINEYNPGTPF